jgi:hypothetical protein
LDWILDLWTLDLGLSNKGTIWQATKIPAQARLALCGGGQSLKQTDPKALLSSAAPPAPFPKKYWKKRKETKRKKRKKKKKKSGGAV